MISSILHLYCFDRFVRGPDPGLWQSFELQIKRKANGHYVAVLQSYR